MSWIELVAQRHPPKAPQGMSPPENAKDWFRMEGSAEDPDATDVLIYSSIGGWFGMWADEFVDELKAVTTSKINLRLNSPGGSVFDGIAIANAIRSHPATVTVYVDSLAASIASVIAMSGDRLVMMPQSQIMVHNASGGCYGDATEMTKMADLLDKQSKNIAQAYAQHTGRPLAEWIDYMSSETWFTAEEAVTVGLADEAMPMKPKKTDAEPVPAEARMHAAWDLSMYRYAGREQAPDPAVKKPVTVRLELDGKDITEHLRPGQQITAQALNEHVPDNATVTRVIDFKDELSEGFVTQFKALVRDAVHEELVSVFDSTAPSHSTAVEDGTWDAGANEKRLPSPVPLATVKKMYTWWDADAVEDGAVPKTSAKLPHHFVSDDGSPGAASVAGVRNALARLPQTQGLTDAERSAAEAHLNKHLNAFKGDEEDHLDDATAPPGEEVEDADKKKLPAFLQPDEDDDDEEEEEAEDASTEEPEDRAPETNNQADDWTSAIGLLHAPTSPSADDVFVNLQEGW
jgi:ATP-dependent Clp endopeptidase proteolytic subunit ClpP